MVGRPGMCSFRPRATLGTPTIRRPGRLPARQPRSRPGLAPMSLGTDTGGSIRSPAAACGIAGLKPTYGRVSRRGIVPNCFSHDHAGPLAWTRRDLALIMKVIAGHDPRDPGSAVREVPDYVAALTEDVEGLVIGVPWRWLEEELPPGPATRAAFDAALDVFRGLGAEIREVSLPPVLELSRDDKGDRGQRAVRHPRPRPPLPAGDVRGEPALSHHRRRAGAGGGIPSGAARPDRSCTRDAGGDGEGGPHHAADRRARGAAAAGASCQHPSRSRATRPLSASRAIPRCRSAAASTRRACRSRCRSSAGSSTRQRSFERETPTSA